jgi:hypothetical protein
MQAYSLLFFFNAANLFIKGVLTNNYKKRKKQPATEGDGS